MSEDKVHDVVINEKNIEVLVTKFIPTSEYFERSFQMLQNQINVLQEGQTDLKHDINRRFEESGERQKTFQEDINRRFEQVDINQKELKTDIDRRFEQVDKRFEQVDKRFELVDKRFDKIDAKLDTILNRMDTKIDAGMMESRAITIRLFSFAMVFSAISMAGFLGKISGLF